MQNATIPMTDDRGRLCNDDPDQNYEPLPGSVVLTHGEWGTAWQRYFSDGLWHSVREGRHCPKDWDWLRRQKNLVLVYDAPEREPVPVAPPVEKRDERVFGDRIEGIG